MQAPDANAYTITLDDERIFSLLIERSTRIKTRWYQDQDSLLRDLDEKNPPMAVFVDINLEGERIGTDVIPSLRERLPHVPILIITANSDPEMWVRGLDLGAIDLIRKPLVPEEVTARLKMRVHEMSMRAAKEVIHFGDIRINAASGVIEGALGRTHLSPTDQKILVYLANHKGMMVTKKALVTHCWGLERVTDNALHRKFHGVREALASVSSKVSLKSHYGKGFSLEDASNQVAI